MMRNERAGGARGIHESGRGEQRRERECEGAELLEGRAESCEG